MSRKPVSHISNMNSTRNFFSRSREETISFARKFARSLKLGDVIALEGDLGSGKTTFIKGIALGLGLSDADEVKSPTFVLMHRYLTKPPLYHFDLYRLDSAREVEAIGLEEFLNDPKAISCVEWADKAPSFFPRSTYRIRIEITGESSRRIEY